MNNQYHCKEQKHVHEILGSTAVVEECGDCHNHRFCTVSGEAMYTQDRKDHYHEIVFRNRFL